MNNLKNTALITGASSGIGAIVADRLAKRGHDLILVARNRERLEAVAARLRGETGRSIDIIVADLNERSDLARIEQVLRSDTSITVLVNSAGFGAPTRLLECNVDRLEEMIDLNVTALMRLTHAALFGFLERGGGGAIINIGSVVGVVPEPLNGVYGGTKAFILAFSRSLHKEFTEKNIRVQVVLPGLTTTAFWDTAATPLQQLPQEKVMRADEMVDALAGFDQGEFITIPSLPELADWEAYETARQNLAPKLSLSSPATRYRVCKEHRQVQNFISR
jgi:hypothetical protein